MQYYGKYRLFLLPGGNMAAGKMLQANHDKSLSKPIAEAIWGVVAFSRERRAKGSCLVGLLLDNINASRSSRQHQQFSIHTQPSHSPLLADSSFRSPTRRSATSPITVPKSPSEGTPRSSAQLKAARKASSRPWSMCDAFDKQVGHRTARGVCVHSQQHWNAPSTL